MEPIKVGMTEFKVAKNPEALTTLSLGSCVGIVLYDPINRIGGLAHPMLPYINESKDKSNPAKYVDSAIDVMLEKMIGLGAIKRHIKAKLFGGANMFPELIKSSDTILNVGARNVAVAKEELELKKIEIAAEDTGRNVGRTVTLYTIDGSVKVKTIKGEEAMY